MLVERTLARLNNSKTSSASTRCTPLQLANARDRSLRGRLSNQSHTSTQRTKLHFTKARGWCLRGRARSRISNSPSASTHCARRACTRGAIRCHADA